MVGMSWAFLAAGMRATVVSESEWTTPREEGRNLLPPGAPTP
jgi:hypothetical protein